MSLLDKRLAPCAFILAWTLVAGCREPSSPGAGVTPRAAPRPLEPLLPQVSDGGEDRDALYRVTPVPPVGPEVPEGALRVVLDGERATVAGQPLRREAVRGLVLVEPTAQTYLVQAAPWLAWLDDAGATVLLAHPDAAVALPVVLRDEAGFQAWLDAPVPGKLRVIHRADGFELQTNMGKLPGADPNGPTVPVRGGQQDLLTLQRGLQRVRTRFPDAPDVCFVPSFGMELQQTIRAMATDYLAPGQTVFPQLCLIYPRPPKDAGR